MSIGCNLGFRSSNGECDDLELTGHVLQILLDALSEMSKGNAISLALHQESSTQEAADLLNVSRPFLVGLLESGKIPFRKVGSHHRVLLTDMLSYKEKTRQQRAHTLKAMSNQNDQQSIMIIAQWRIALQKRH